MIRSALFRVLFAIEFLLALVAVFALWSQVGGQYHLDLMPWYWKLVLGPGLAVAAVRATMAAVEREKVWNSKTIAWLVVALALMTIMAAVTYYCHVYEPADEDDTESTNAAVARHPVDVRAPMAGGLQSRKI